MSSAADQDLKQPASSSNDNPKLTCSVVICTVGRLDLLRGCLGAVFQMVPSADEVMVVDNTPGSAAIRAIATEFGARYVVEPARGLSRARNCGMAQSVSALVAYLDDDATPKRDWLGHILKPFEDPEVAIVTGEVVFHPATTNPAVEGPPRTLSNRDPQWFEIATFGGLGLGSNMVLRRSTCAGRKVFDERLGSGAPFNIAEENYAFASLLASGFRAAHVPAAVVFHPAKALNVLKFATCAFAYWLLLLAEFPNHRAELIRYLFRRWRKLPLPWPRDPQGAGEIMRAGWRLQLRAVVAGFFLFLRHRGASRQATFVRGQS